MLAHRKVPLSEIDQLNFLEEDVLDTAEERTTRRHQLESAMALTHVEHEEVSLIVKLATGEEVELTSNLIDLGQKFVDLREGKSIPLRAILRVGV